MAGRGRAPKDAAQRRRTNKEHRDQIAAPVPEVRPVPAGKWHPNAVLWWEEWARSEQATKFTPVTWQVLFETLALVSRYWEVVLDPQVFDTGPAMKLATEIRLRVSRLGATPLDLRDLKWDMAPTEARPEQPAAAVSSIDKWRKLALGDAV